MHKKLTSELISLANSIIAMSEDTDITTLHKKSRKLYEKLSVLKFVEKNLIVATKAPEKRSEEVINKTTTVETPNISVEKQEEKEVLKEEIIIKKETPPETGTKIIEKEDTKTSLLSNGIEAAIKAAKDIKKATELKYSLETEFKDAVSADMAQEIFEGADKRVIQSKLATPQSEPIKKTLNKSGMQQGIQIGLNDRIAFVKYLFNGNLTDFNRVLSQLNTFSNQKEALDFISKVVKPDYNWDEHEDIENRLLEIIERKFS